MAIIARLTPRFRGKQLGRYDRGPGKGENLKRRLIMARNGFKAMDSDMHVIEPLDLWQRYTEPDFKDRAPRGLERWMGDMQIELEGCLMPTEPEDWATDKAQEQDDTYRHSHENGWDPASQVRAMDLEGLDIAFLYPSRELFALAFDKLDPALGAAISRAYNQWMHDFCSYAPNRLFGAAMISPFDAESAAVEARRAAKDLELKAVFIRPNVVNERNWHDSYYDPLWA
jgi:predicted TIM-barrel fold metal-dependent hydrolase